MWRFSLWLVERAKWLVPLHARDGFEESWKGELWHRARALAPTGDLSTREQLDLLRRSLGAFSHALWLAHREWRGTDVWQDVLYGIRGWLARPGFTFVALMTLGLGIGANTYIFSVVDGVLLRPFPFADVDRLVTLGVTFPQYSEEEKFIEALSIPDYREIVAESETLTSFLAFDLGNRDLGGIDEPQRLFTAAFWGDPFETLGMQPAVGRSFTAEEVERGDPVAIVSHRVWQQHFGGRADAVGQPVVVNGIKRTLIGVMPPRLLLLDTDLWLPMWYTNVELPRSRRVLTVLARVADDVSLAESRSELSAFAGRISQDLTPESPEYEGFRLSATPFVDVWASFVGPAGQLLLGAVGFVLLIVCANIAGLLLAKASARRHEMAVRSAIGAGRGRLFQQLLTEAFLLAVGGAIVALGVAHLGIQLTWRYLPADLPLGGIEIGLNGLVLGYTLGIAVLCGLFVGLAPALQGARVNVRSNLSSDGSGTTRGASSLKLRRAFVLCQLSLSLVLLTGAGLLIKSFLRLSAVDPGVNVENVLTMRLTLPWERYEGKLEPFYTQLLDEVARIPGIRSAGLATQFPPMVFRESPVTIEGREPTSDGALPTASVSVASAGLFETLGVRLVRGRGFSSSDTADTPNVALINQTMAERYFPGTDPLGQRLRSGKEDTGTTWATVVGIVSDTRNRGVARGAVPEVVYSYLQQGQWSNQMFLLVRSESDPYAVLAPVRDALGKIDPDQPVYAVTSLEDLFASTIATSRIAGVALIALAGVAMLLAAMGMYAVVAVSVSERQREFGIRVALGASGSELVRRVLTQTGKLVTAGIVVGSVLAVGLAHLLRSFLFDVNPYDPAVLAATALVLAAVATGAALGPARRAASVDPTATFK